MEEKDLINRFFQVVAYDLTHKHYKHVTEKANLYNQLVTGIGLDALLKQYVRREDAELFKQRVALTKHIAPAICKNLLDVFYKIPRSNSARRVITYDMDSPEKRVQELEGVLNKFWGNSSWDQYMGSRFIELNSVDPNSFVVFEWDNFDANKELLQPRPFEVSSASAVDFLYKNQILQYLIVKQAHWYDTTPLHEKISATLQKKLKRPDDGLKEGFKFTLYGPNKTWQLRQINDAYASQPIVEEGVPVKATIDGQAIQIVKLGANHYIFEEFLPHDLGYVPAFRVGYYRDLATGGDTYVNQLNAVEPYLLKSIKTNSEFDLVATLLALPQQIRLGEKCADEKCYKGYYSDGIECNTCHGTGIKAGAPSAQDAIVIPMPENKEDLIPLEDFIKYIHPPVDIIQWQEKYIDKLTEKCKQTMFNSDVFTKAEVTDTATGKNLDMQNVYDTLYPFAMRFAKIWVFGTKTFAKLIQREENLVVNYTFGKDFKLKTRDNLIYDLSMANNLNNASLVKHLNDDIAEIIFSEKPIELQRYKLQQFYNPFNGKTEADIRLFLLSDLVPKRQKVLYANFSSLLDSLELEYAEKKINFYALKRTEQSKAIYKKVDELIAEITNETPDPQLLLN